MAFNVNWLCAMNTAQHLKPQVSNFAFLLAVSDKTLLCDLTNKSNLLAISDIDELCDLAHNLFTGDRHDRISP